MKYIVIFLLCFSALHLDAKFQDIPKPEANKIKCLFEYLINEHDFAYVIFGSKPMALADLCLWMPNVPLQRQFRAHMLLIQKKERLNAWNKYKHEILFKDFILLDNETNLFNCLVFVLIHKPHMLSLLHIHEKIFKEVLGNAFSPEKFLEQIEKREISLAEAIAHHRGLLGIMLGYGVKNSMLYQEKYHLSKEIEKNKAFLRTGSTVHNRFQEINSQLKPFSKFEEFSCVSPLYFCADLNHPETKELKKRYENDRKKIEVFKKDKNFIDIALQKLMN